MRPTGFGKLNLVNVSGDAYDMGYQYGLVLNHRIINVYRCIVQSIRNSWPHAYDEVHAFMLDIFEQMEPYFPEEYLEELQGVVAGARAAGADVCPDMLRLLFSAANGPGDLHQSNTVRSAINDTTKSSPSLISFFNCASFACWGRRTRDRKLIGSRVLDFAGDVGLGDHGVVTVYRPRHGIGYMTIGFSGIIGAMAGINEFGVAFGEINALSVRQRFKGCPWAIKFRQVLSRASNLDEAIRIFRETPDTLGYNFVLMDGDAPNQGRGARACVIETNAEDFSLFYDDDEKERNAVAVDRDGTEIMDSDGRLISFGLPLKDAVYRSDCSFDPTVRSQQTACNGPAGPEPEPGKNNDIGGDPRGHRAYRIRYRRVHDALSRRTEPLEVSDAISLNRSIAKGRDNVMTTVYAASDLDVYVAFQNQVADKWRRASASPHHRLNLLEELALDR